MKKKLNTTSGHHRWELLGCSRYGHVTYAPVEEKYAENLHVDTPMGEAWRCLRCGVYVPGKPVAEGHAENAPVPKRGNELREAVIMRFLAAERIIRFIVLLVAAYGLWKFNGAKNSVGRAVHNNLPLLNEISQKLHYNLSDSAPMRLINRGVGASHHNLNLIITALIVYAFIELAEGIGLWSLKRWGEYVAVVGTSIFLPLEVYELTENLSVLKIITLLINLALVVWLIYKKRLFGVRGGSKAYQDENEDEAVLELERANKK